MTPRPSFGECMKIATGFLATKERKNYYLFTARRDKRDTGYSYLDVLSDSDVAQLRTLMGKYGKDFVSHLVTFDEAKADSELILG